MKEAIKLLKKKYDQKGYITFDEIIATSKSAELSLKSIDSVTEQLMDEGILILEKPSLQDTGGVVDDNDYDKSHIDYEIIYNEVLRIAPQLSNYIDEVRKIPAPRFGEENQLIVLAKKGNNYAITRLILMFLKIVLRTALFFFKQYGLPLEETIQEGNIGLIIAIEKFKIYPGNRFSTYAPWWIRQNITRYSTGICDKFYIPTYLRDELLKLIKYIGPKNLELFQGNLFQSLDIKDAIKSTGLKKSDIEKYLIWLEEPYSLEDIRDENNNSLFLINSMEEEALDRVFYQRIVESILAYLNTLNDRNRKIIELRYGLNGLMPKTLEEVGNEFGITRERVRQIEKHYFYKLKIKILQKHFSRSGYLK